MLTFDRKTFFDKYRQAFGPLQQLQVDGLEFLLGSIENDPKWESIPQIAYFLASIKHETGISRNRVDQTYQPIKELRAKPGTRIRALQDRYWGSDYFGRGFIQLTWKANYEKFGIADDPEKALEPATAYRIAADGMRRGLFTGKKLSDFINGEVDYVNARKVVNGLDRANDIAEIARKFERILRTSVVKEGEKPAAAELVEEIEAAEEPKPEPLKEDPPVQTLPTPQINVEHADQVKADASLPVEGGRKDDPPKQASQGGLKSTIATIFGGIGGLLTAIAGWLQNNGSLAMVGVICLTIVLLAWIFRQLIMDYFRMKYVADPTKINVK
jgi:putative chitinase